MVGLLTITYDIILLSQHFLIYGPAKDSSTDSLLHCSDDSLIEVNADQVRTVQNNLT